MSLLEDLKSVDPKDRKVYLEYLKYRYITYTVGATIVCVSLIIGLIKEDALHLQSREPVCTTLHIKQG